MIALAISLEGLRVWIAIQPVDRGRHWNCRALTERLPNPHYL